MIEPDACGEPPAPSGTFGEMPAPAPAPRAVLADIADFLPLMVWRFDADGRHDWVNEECARYFGVRREDLTGRRWGAIFHPDDLPGYRESFVAAMREQRAFHGLMRVARADGAYRWLETWSNPAFAPDGEYLGHVGVSADVTERKAAEDALRSVAVRESFRARLLGFLRIAADPVTVQARAAELLGRELGASRVHYLEVDESEEFGRIHAGYDLAGREAPGVVRFADHGPAIVSALRGGRVVMIPDAANDPRLAHAPRDDATPLGAAGAYLLVPLVKQGRPVATIAVHHAEPHRYTADEIALVEQAAELTWSAVEEARAEHAARIRHVRAELLAEVISELERQATMPAMAQRLTELLVPRFADYATVEAPWQPDRLLGISHRDPESVAVLRRLRTEHVLAPEEPGALDGAAVGRPLLASVITAADRAGVAARSGGGELLELLAPRSHMAVPLDLGGDVRGVLMIGISDPQRPAYSADDLAFLEEAAQRVGIVLAAARLRQQEHDIAVRLQQSLLPDELSWHPNMVVAARYHAASSMLEVGGDWFDTFTWPDGRTGVMVGDVAGHNLDSAAAMGRLRAATAALATHTRPSPGALIDALDRFASGPDGTDFATAVCVVLDPETGRLTYASAGHPPVVVVPPGGPAFRLTGAQSLPLCSLSEGLRPEGSVCLEPGSLVVLYSDGLVERRRRSLEDGIASLEQRLTGFAGRSADAVADLLVQDVAALDPPGGDDVVVACFRYTPPRARFRRSIEARGGALAALRAELRGWLASTGVAAPVRHRVVLVVGEACANVVEHAYGRTGPRPVDVEISHHGVHLAVRVKDRGTWRPAGPHCPGRGHGTRLMTAYAERFSRQNRGDGTVVLLTLPVDPAPSREDVAGHLMPEAGVGSPVAS